jgi:hypothetical protein
MINAGGRILWRTRNTSFDAAHKRESVRLYVLAQSLHQLVKCCEEVDDAFLVGPLLVCLQRFYKGGEDGGERLELG